LGEGVLEVGQWVLSDAAPVVPSMADQMGSAQFKGRGIAPGFAGRLDNKDDMAGALGRASIDIGATKRDGRLVFGITTTGVGPPRGAYGHRSTRCACCSGLGGRRGAPSLGLLWPDGDKLRNHFWLIRQRLSTRAESWTAHGHSSRETHAAGRPSKTIGPRRGAKSAGWHPQRDPHCAAHQPTTGDATGSKRPRGGPFRSAESKPNANDASRPRQQ